MLFGFSWSHTFLYRGGSILTLRACVIVCVERISSPFLYFCSVLQQPHKKYHQLNRPLPSSSCFSIHFGMTLFFVSHIAISKPGNVHHWGRAFLKMTNFLLLFDVCYRWIRMLRWLRRNWRWDTNFLLQYICCKISWHFQQAQICNQKFRKTFGLWCHKYLLSHVSSSCLNQNWYKQTYRSDMSKSQATFFG